MVCEESVVCSVGRSIFSTIRSTEQCLKIILDVSGQIRYVIRSVYIGMCMKIVNWISMSLLVLCGIEYRVFHIPVSKSTWWFMVLETFVNCPTVHRCYHLFYFKNCKWIQCLILIGFLVPFLLNTKISLCFMKTRKQPPRKVTLLNWTPPYETYMRHHSRLSNEHTGEGLCDNLQRKGIFTLSLNICISIFSSETWNDSIH